VTSRRAQPSPFSALLVRLAQTELSGLAQAAISRMVHLLEQRLGVALFERKANRLPTTPARRGADKMNSNYWIRP
jgi:hypothetical protein